MAFTSLVRDVLDHTEVVLDGRCGWTSSSLMTKVDLAAGLQEDQKHQMSAGASVQWSVGVLSYDILVQARFVPRSGNTQQMIFSEKQLGDPYQSHLGSWISGHFTADAEGTLEIHLNNSCVRHPRQQCSLLRHSRLNLVRLHWPGKAFSPGE
jgi:hypothetical protein